MSVNTSGDNQKSGVVCCDEICKQLPAYMLRELGDSQSRLVHEHIRLCDRCRGEAARLEMVSAMLRDCKQSDDRNVQPVLSEQHLARLRFRVLHPVFDWIYYRHRLVSSVCAVVLLGVLLFILRHVALFQEPDLEGSIPIWRMFRSGRLPERVEEAARRYEQTREDGRGANGDDGGGEP